MSIDYARYFPAIAAWLRAGGGAINGRVLRHDQVSRGDADVCSAWAALYFAATGRERFGADDLGPTAEFHEQYSLLADVLTCPDNRVRGVIAAMLMGDDVQAATAAAREAGLPVYIDEPARVGYAGAWCYGVCDVDVVDGTRPVYCYGDCRVTVHRRDVHCYDRCVVDIERSGHATCAGQCIVRVHNGGDATCHDGCIVDVFGGGHATCYDECRLYVDGGSADAFGDCNVLMYDGAAWCRGRCRLDVSGGSARCWGECVAIVNGGDAKFWDHCYVLQYGGTVEGYDDCTVVHPNDPASDDPPRFEPGDSADCDCGCDPDPESEPVSEPSPEPEQTGGNAHLTWRSTRFPH